MAGDKPGAANAASPLRFAFILAAKIGLELLRYFTRIVIAIVRLFGTILPIRALLRATNALSRRAPALTAWAPARLDWFERRSVVGGVMADVLWRPSDRRTGVSLLDPSLLAPVCPAPRRPIMRVAADDAGPVRDFLALLERHSVAKFRKIRVGGDHDGGYVMPDDFTGAAAALSLGVGGDVSWDIAIADRGIRVLQYDDSVDDALVQHQGCTFHRTRIVPVAPAGQSEATIDAIVADLDLSGDLLLKMDIEGDEWRVFEALDAATIARFRQIVFEFHYLERLDDPAWRLRARGTLEKLCRTHCVLHVRGNNCKSLALFGSGFAPCVVEMTFVGRDAYEIGASTEIFPIELDRPNDPAAPDLFLGSFRFK
jgi:hypothetical protein